MATIFDIANWDVVSESILASVGDLNLTIVTTDFNGVATVEVPMPADVAVVDVGVVGLGNQPGSGGAVDSVNGQTGVVSLTQDNVPDGTTHKQYSATEKTKLAGVATGATANSTDAQLRDRTTHTGSQAISTVTGLQTAIDAKAPLASPAFTGTPTGITKAHVGLGNVDNTADNAKPVSTAQQTALDGKANTSHTHAQADVTGLATLLALGFYYADGTTSTNARPSVPGKVLWVGGTIQPVNMATGDLWISE